MTKIHDKANPHRWNWKGEDPKRAPCGAARKYPQSDDPAKVTCKSCLRGIADRQKEAERRAAYEAEQKRLDARRGVWEVYRRGRDYFSTNWEHVRYVYGQKPTLDKDEFPSYFWEYGIRWVDDPKYLHDLVKQWSDWVENATPILKKIKR